MGVERFFSSLRRDYNFIHEVHEKIECEHLLIDFNSIVHITSQFLLNNKTLSSSSVFETMLIEEVGKYILKLLKTQFYERKLISITICVDGVPTMSKIFEQKKRRYMGDLLSNFNEKDNSFYWSRNNISPGTEFMNNMMTFLNSANFQEQINQICHNLKIYKVSGIDLMGEGEIKILHIIDMMVKTKFKYDRFVVYSPDSDMIILLLMTNINVLMLRYDQQLSTYEMPIYSKVDINHFKNILYEYISNKMNKKVEQTRIIMDIVFILTVFGDDFLPKLETVRVNTDILLLINHYVLILIKHGYILDYKLNKYSINTENFFEFLKLLQKKEDYFLKRNARYHVVSNYYKLVSDIIGYNMNILREYIIEYLWKFIYYNKPDHIKVSPLNAHKHIGIDILESFMNNVEPQININNMNKFTNIEYKNNLLWDKMLQIISDNYIELLNYIDGIKMKKENIYSNETFYIASLPNQLLKDIILYFYITYELPLTIPLKTSHDKLNINNYNSTENPHRTRLTRLSRLEQNQYKIDNKLDNYYKILHPKDDFYYSIYKNNTINYSQYYSVNFNNNVNKIVDDYLLGYNWIVNYYHNTNSEYNNIDLTWYYNHNRSPLLKDIVNNYNYKLLIKPLVNTFLENKIKYMTPLEHYLYVSPIDYTSKHLEEDLIKIFTTMPIGKIKKLVYFITRNSKYYYPLNKIYNNMSKEKYVDCSSSIFISKCHLLFMENYIDMMEYIINFRKLN